MKFDDVLANLGLTIFLLLKSATKLWLFLLKKLIRFVATLTEEVKPRLAKNTISGLGEFNQAHPKVSLDEHRIVASEDIERRVPSGHEALRIQGQKPRSALRREADGSRHTKIVGLDFRAAVLGTCQYGGDRADSRLAPSQ